MHSIHFRETQLFKAILLLITTFVTSGLGYYILGYFHPNPHVHWSLFDCFYMSTITLTTVGFGEVLESMDTFVAARVYTMLVLVFGTGFLVYAASAGTAFIVEGELKHLLEKRRMTKRIEHLTGHYIICGAGGSTGLYVVRELIDTGKTFVVVEKDQERLDRLRQMGCTYIVEGDATDDETLVAAGITRAAGLGCCLHDDKSNLYLTVTARQLNSEIRIVAQNQEMGARPKMVKAGANSAVSPNRIGGLRLVSELIRPSVTTFLDTMLRDTKRNIRFAEVTVGAESELVGLTLAEAAIERNPGLPVLALRSRDDADFTFEPEPTIRLEAGYVIIVIGSRERVEALERRASANLPEPEDA